MSEVRTALEVKEAIERGENMENKMLLLEAIKGIQVQTGEDAKHVLATLFPDDLLEYQALVDEESRREFLADRTVRNLVGEEESSADMT